MATIRGVKRIFSAVPTMEGAGVRLHRAFSSPQAYEMDPFLLLDDFSSKKAEDYIKGFPWHPHRGIETVTYIKSGSVRHGDSLGNKGVISAGEVQWMIAGSGIIHEEMPQKSARGLQGFQLWVNLSSKDKMSGPAYQGIVSREIPSEIGKDGIKIAVISGKLGKLKGPAHARSTDAEYLDISMPKAARFSHSIKKGYTAFAYVYKGSGTFGSGGKAKAGQLIVFSDGDSINAESKDEPLEFILVSGKPLREPIAWGGPIVMNTESELQQAFDEYFKGTFIK